MWQEGPTRPSQHQVTVNNFTEMNLLFWLFVVFCTDPGDSSEEPRRDAKGCLRASRPALVLQLSSTSFICSAVLCCDGIEGVETVLFAFQPWSQHEIKPKLHFAYLSVTSFP